jgi:hypothetical protein
MPYVKQHVFAICLEVPLLNVNLSEMGGGGITKKKKESITIKLYHTYSLSCREIHGAM